MARYGTKMDYNINRKEKKPTNIHTSVVSFFFFFLGPLGKVGGLPRSNKRNHKTHYRRTGRSTLRGNGSKIMLCNDDESTRAEKVIEGTTPRVDSCRRRGDVRELGLAEVEVVLVCLCSCRGRGFG